MDFILSIIDIMLHLDTYLGTLIQSYGLWTYLILFGIIFAETGFVITPFLPGDSLIFAAAAFAGLGLLNPWLIFGLLTLAGILGDSVNYAIGHAVGPRVFREDVRFLKREYLDRTHEFYEKHGGKTIILARFVPIIRTFAPFVAGVGAMTYQRFVVFNVAGAILWVGLFTALGYFFGNLPAVEKNFALVILGIIFVSLLPPIIEVLRGRTKKS
ncbi:MAG: DedA family protein [Chloroflexi bacterium]|nr:DedA family protein [Chloroflexota bacterium]MQC26406.1 DedA family protein [Chloroflexota bacterium]